MDSPKPNLRRLKELFRSPGESLLIEVARARGLVTDLQIEEACREQVRLRDEGQDLPIGRVLVLQGYLQPHQYEALTSQPDDSQETGPRLGKYWLRRVAGQGGMGRVYEAEDPELRRRVALKVLREDQVDRSTVARFRREAQIAAQLHHPNIVPVYEIGEARNESGAWLHFIAMEYVDGRTFQQLLDDRKSDRGDLLRILEETARGVGHAHRQGVVHRDLKPANVLVEEGGRVLVGDFGLARALSFATQLTMADAVMGTPAYMAPEQVRGESGKVDARADVWALGVILYQILARKLPFSGSSEAQVFERVLRNDPIPPHRWAPKIDRNLEVVCLKALSKEKERRFADGESFADELARVRRGEPIRSRPESVAYRWRRWTVRNRGRMALAGLIAAVAAASIVSAFALRRQRESRLAEERAKRHQRLVIEKVQPLLGRIQEAKAFFYIADVDIEAKRREIEEALGELERIAVEEMDGGNTDVWTSMGAGWYFVGDDRRAEAALTRAMQLDPNHAPASAYLGRICLDRCLTVSLDAEPRPQSQWKVALAQAEQALKEATGMERYILQAYRRAASRNREEAAQTCREALEQFGNALGTEQFWFLLGLLNGDRQEAVDCLSRALARRPHYAVASFQRGVVYAALGETDRAIEDYTATIHENPRLARVYYNRALARRTKGDREGALADYDEAIRLAPEECTTYFNRGLLREENGDPRGALEDFETLLRLDPRDAKTYVRRGILRARTGDEELATEDFTRAIEADSTYAKAYYNRACMNLKRGDTERALRDYDEAIRLDPNQACFYCNRGLARKTSGELDLAIDDFSKSLELDPNDGNHHFHRALARACKGERSVQQGRREEGTALWRSALADCDEALKRLPSEKAGEVRRLREDLLRRLDGP